MNFQSHHKNIFKDFFSFEMLFVLFLFSGILKELYGIKFRIDTTLVLMIVLVTSTMFIIYKQKTVTHIQIIASFIFTIFITYLLITGLFITGENYFIAKLTGMSTTIVAFFASMFVVTTKPVRVQKLIYCLYCFSIVSGIGIVVISIVHNIDQLQDVAPYQLTTLLFGFGFILSLHFSLKNVQKTKIFLLHLSLSAFFIFIMLSSGGRGAFVSSIIASLFLITVFLINNYELGYRTIVQTSTFICLILIASFPIYSYFNTNFRTIERLLVDSPLQNRLMYYPTAFRSILNNPLFGIGFGGWPSVWYQVHDHPHNILLEITTESGFIGLFLFLSIVIYLLSHFRPIIHSNNNNKIVVLVIVIYLLIWRMVSGDLASDRYLFTFLALLAYPSVSNP